MLQHGWGRGNLQVSAVYSLAACFCLPVRVYTAQCVSRGVDFEHHGHICKTVPNLPNSKGLESITSPEVKVFLSLMLLPGLGDFI